MARNGGGFEPDLLHRYLGPSLIRTKGSFGNKGPDGRKGKRSTLSLALANAETTAVYSGTPLISLRGSNTDNATQRRSNSLSKAKVLASLTAGGRRPLKEPEELLSVGYSGRAAAASRHGHRTAAGLQSELASCGVGLIPRDPEEVAVGRSRPLAMTASILGHDCATAPRRSHSPAPAACYRKQRCRYCSESPPSSDRWCSLAAAAGTLEWNGAAGFGRCGCCCRTTAPQRRRRCHSGESPCCDSCGCGAAIAAREDRSSCCGCACAYCLAIAADYSPPPSYCFLTLTKSQEANSERNQKRSSTSLLDAPLITISIPPNCRIIRSDDSLELHRGSSPCDSCGDSNSNSPTISSAGDGDSAIEFGFSLSDADISASSSLTTSSHSTDDDNAFVNPTPPPPRPWISLSQINSQQLAKFTVLCYNVLCDKYASTSLYSYCPSWALDWEYRKVRIAEEIKQYHADIVTLQEVETCEFGCFFQPMMQVRGYDGIFSPKSRAKTMTEEEKRHVDGCAIFWKADKFALEDERLIEFTQLAIDHASGSKPMLNRVMTRDNIALVAILNLKENVYETVPRSAEESMVSEPFAVCTAHIHWDPEFCDVKLVQTMMLVSELGNILEETAANWNLKAKRRGSTATRNAEDIPFLICGDLNSLPDSGVFEFLTCGRISADHKDFKDFNRESCLHKWSSTAFDSRTRSFTHSLDAVSSYSNDIMPFTNYTFDFKGMIDYIFGSRRSLARLGVLGPFDADWFCQNKVLGCPHPMIPSDHFPLLAQFAFLPLSHQVSNPQTSGASSHVISGPPHCSNAAAEQPAAPAGESQTDGSTAAARAAAEERDLAAQFTNHHSRYYHSGLTTSSGGAGPGGNATSNSSSHIRSPVYDVL